MSAVLATTVSDRASSLRPYRIVAHIGHSFPSGGMFTEGSRSWLLRDGAYDADPVCAKSAAPFALVLGLLACQWR